MLSGTPILPMSCSRAPRRICTRSVGSDPQQVSQLNGHFGHPQGMPFGFPVAQVERLRPAFDGGVVRQREVEVGLLQFLEQHRVIDGDGCLPRQGLQEISPLRVRFHRAAMEGFEDALDLSLGDQGHSKVGYEPFLGQ